MTSDNKEIAGLLRKESDKAVIIAEELRLVSPCDVNKPDISRIPNDPGIYIWLSKDTGHIVYVGVALGRRGLSQRIASQHLRASYRKSVFRIKIAEDFGVGLGEESVDFIRKSFLLSYLPCPKVNAVTLRIAELLLIAVHQPKYNSALAVG